MGIPSSAASTIAKWRGLIGAAPPTFVTPDLNSPRAARAEADRRVKNSRMLAELGVKLAYPDYRGGLAAILADC